MTDRRHRAGPPTDMPASYPVDESMVRFRSGRVIDVRTDLVSMPDGSVAPRDIVEHPGAVGVLAMDHDGRVLLLEQYRHAVRRKLWEPPAGLLDQPGEDPLAAAKRELLEEAHLRAERWDVLVDAFTTPGMCNEAVRVYLARDVRIADGPRFEGQHEERDLPSLWVTLDDAVAAVLGGRLHNPMAVMGILAAAALRAQDWAGLRPAGVPWPERPAGDTSARPGSSGQDAAAGRA